MSHGAGGRAHRTDTTLCTEPTSEEGCSRMTALAPADGGGINRVWASKQVKSGAAAASMVASGEKLEAK